MQIPGELTNTSELVKRSGSLEPKCFFFLNVVADLWQIVLGLVPCDNQIAKQKEFTFVNIMVIHYNYVVYNH